MFILMLMLVAIILSCKKKNTDQALPLYSGSSLIKSIHVTDTIGRNLLFNIHYYDSLERVIRISETIYSNLTDSTNFIYTIEYYPGKVVMKKANANSQFYEKLIYNLNSNGLAEFFVRYEFNSPQDSTMEESYNFQYNSEKYLITQIGSIPGGSSVTSTYQYTNLNVVSINFISTTGHASKQLYYYNGAQHNTIGNFNTGMYFLGNSCYNSVIQSSMDSSNLVLSRYSYNYDANNNITQCTINGMWPMPCLSWASVPVLTSKEIIHYTYY